MAALLRKILPAVPTVGSDDEDDNVEYSFALEYSGPPLGYDIPQLAPVNIKGIPIAAVADSVSTLDVLLPVVEPIVKTDQSNNKLWKELKLGSEDVAPMVSAISPPAVAASAVDDKDSTFDMSDGIEKSAMLGLSDTDDNYSELSRSSSVLEVAEEYREHTGFEDYMNPTNWESTESGLSSPVLPTGGISSKGEDFDSEVPHHVERPSIVTFRDPESIDIIVEESESTLVEPEIVHVKQRVESNVKKGLCYRCLRGYRFTEKEACIVCGAKYCCNCVLRAMGSMPEGRKCIDCIGCGIDESKRGTLGKCSRMLKKLLAESELKRVMSAEMLCEANLIPPKLVFVNDKYLCEEELYVLLNCPNPPRKLKLGRYWYDKVSGFWGEEGEKPCQIISPELDVGGHLRKDCSNGNTSVLINNREITKAELWMLKLSGIQCEGKPHFWVSADGSYQEEGQKNVKGKIWGKTKTKLLCTVLDLPTPSVLVNPREDEANGPILVHHKLLLVGYNKSGTSTIFKQAKLLYNVPFSEDERNNIKSVIQSNLYGYLGVLLEGRERFEEETSINKKNTHDVDQPGPSGELRESGSDQSATGNVDEIAKQMIYSIGPRLKAFSDWLLKVMASGNLEAIFTAAAREYAPFVEELWRDPAIQATYDRRNELEMLPRFATYFLERAIEISRTEYEPSDIDILYAEGITSSNGLACVEFLLPKTEREDSLDPAYHHDSTRRYQLIRVHPKSLGENCKWLEMFEDVDVVLFCVSLSDYDEFTVDSDGVSTNKMLASKQLFESLVTHPTFGKKNFLLILNKFDMLEEKIEQVPLHTCNWFHDFNPVISHNHKSGPNNRNTISLAQHAFHYISLKFKRLFSSLTDERKLYVSSVTGLEPDTVDEAFRYAREILKWNEDEPSFNEVSSSSIEQSSSS